MKWSQLLVPFCAVLMCCAPAAGDEYAGVEAVNMELTLDDAIALALRNNRSLLDARLSRTVQEYALDVARDRYRPRGRIGPSARAEKDGEPAALLITQGSLRVPTGGEMTLRWSKRLAGEGEHSGVYSLSFEQPLLRGFGVGVDTAPLRMAQLGDEISVLSFKETISQIVASTIRSWRGLVRANRQVQIAEASLQRARDQLEVNRLLIQAGRMAEREILHNEADVVSREFALEESRNGVVEANFALIDILDINSTARIRPLETTLAQRTAPSMAEGVEIALRNWPRYSMALLDAEIAKIGLRVAENDRLWDLSLDTQASLTGGQTDYAAELRLTVPLWDRSPRLAWTSAQAEVQMAERGLLELRQAIDIAVRQALHGVEVGLRQIALARRALALEQQKLDVERSKLRQGLSSAFQLSQLEDDLVRAQNTEVDAVFDYEDALTSLDLTLGTTLETWGILVERVGR